MKILISEYITSGALSDQPMPVSLQREGLLMLKELVCLSNLLDDIEPIITLDHRIDYRPDKVEVHTVVDPNGYEDTIGRILQLCDAGWIIAPESDHILYRNIQCLELAGLPTLNCSLAAVRLCADKFQSAYELAEMGIPMIPTAILGASSLAAERWVIKPRFGVGCEQIEEHDQATRDDYLRTIDRPDDWIEQPFIEGRAGSVSIFVWNQQMQILSYNEQSIERRKDGYCLAGCTTNAAPIREQTRSTMEQLVECLPGLKGYFGVDIIETGDQTWIVEINPRLTTSAVGLYAATGINLVALAISSMQCGELQPAIKTCDQAVEVSLL